MRAISFAAHARSTSAVAARSLVMRTLIRRFAKDEKAATAIEYAIIAGGLSIVIVTVVSSIGVNLNTKFTSISTAVK
jgi:pilus assembly protein Flp/PilA